MFEHCWLTSRLRSLNRYPDTPWPNYPPFPQRRHASHHLPLTIYRTHFSISDMNEIEENDTMHVKLAKIEQPRALAILIGSTFLSPIKPCSPSYLPPQVATLSSQFLLSRFFVSSVLLLSWLASFVDVVLHFCWNCEEIVLFGNPSS